MGSLLAVTTSALILALSRSERLLAMKREEGDLPWGWIGLGVLGVIGVGIALWLRGRKQDARIDRDVLTARVKDRGFTEDERDLMQRIADRQEKGRASDLVPKLRKYDAALEAFLAEETAGLTEAEREALAETLSSLRSKLGFEHMAEYRNIPSTREVSVGTAMMARPESEPDLKPQPAVVHHVDELTLKIHMVSEDVRPEETAPDAGVTYRPGDRVEFFFGHGPRRRCRFTSRITGPAEGRGRIYPMSHAKVENIALSRSGRGDIAVDGELRVVGADPIPVVLLELTGSGARLSAPLPESVRLGTLAFRLPGDKSLLEIEVARPDTASEEATPIERSRLRFLSLSEDHRQRIFGFIRQASAPQPV